MTEYLNEEEGLKVSRETDPVKKMKKSKKVLDRQKKSYNIS